MKATKRNICKNGNYNEVVKIRELIEKAIPYDANTLDVTEALLGELVEVMTFFHRWLGRYMGRRVYEYCVKWLEDGYNDILKEEENG